MKKIKWAGFSVQMIMFILMLLLVFLHQPIPDFVMIIFAGGMLTCIISSLRENKTQKRLIGLKGKYY
jgi:hypothetical protein